MTEQMKHPQSASEVEPLPTEPLPTEIQAWLDASFERHLARWKQEIAEGLRDATGRWVGDPALRRRHSFINKESKEWQA